MNIFVTLHSVLYVHIIMQLLSDADLAKILDQDIFHLISEAADGLGLECYVVGGYVRDLFLERPPTTSMSWS